jgi:zinc transport system permease protein
LLELLSLSSVQRGLAALLIAGIILPQAGLAVIRMNLLPLRFMLIHGLLLGGALGLALHLNPLFTALVVNIILVCLMLITTRKTKGNFGYMGALFMAFSAALASFIIYRFKVPARETQFLLWGSPFSISPGELYIFLVLSLIFIIIRIRFHRGLNAVFFDSELAASSGLKEGLYTWSVVISTAVLVSFAMRILGALLMDLLILMPALAAGWIFKSFKQVSIGASFLGLLLSILGFTTALLLDIPLSTALALPVMFLMIILLLMKRRF